MASDLTEDLKREISELQHALYRLKTECEIEGLQNLPGFDAWISLANEALNGWRPDFGAARPPRKPTITIEAAVGAVETMQERCAELCDERAAYFDRTSGHFDRKDAANSYSRTATAIRLMGSPGLKQAAARTPTRTTGHE